MKEVYEFRVREKYASRLFEPNEGKKLGWTKLFGDEFVTIRKIELPNGDSRFKRIGELHASIQKEHADFFFAGWDIQRSYSTDELRKAKLFLLHHISTFEPAGEECGTQYDESSACPSCKSGAKQSSPLFLDWKRIPKNKDVARTIAGEIVVSKRFAELLKRHSITGAELGPIYNQQASSAASRDWFQLLIKSCDIEVTAPTKIGINPFDEDKEGQYRCSRGDLIGLARLSEVSVSHLSYGALDFVATRQFVGTRRGLLRPERLLLISPKLFRIISEQKLKGWKHEVVHLVNGA